MVIEGRDTRPDQLTATNLIRLPSYVASGVRYHAAGRIYTPKPIYVGLRVTRRCNAEGITYPDGRNEDNGGELAISEIRGVLGSSLFESVEKFVLGGGEATLRGDLLEIAEIVLDSCPQLKEMLLRTNGMEPALVVERVGEILELPGYSRLNRFSVSVSLDGYGDTLESITKVTQAFDRVSETIDRLKNLKRKRPFYLCAVCTVMPFNIGDLARLSEFSREQGLPISFVPMNSGGRMHLNSAVDDATEGSLRLNANHVEELDSLFGREAKIDLPLSNIPFWREYFGIINGDKRKLPCSLRHQHAGIDSDGTVYACVPAMSLTYGNVRDETPDRLWYSDRAMEIRKKIKKHFCPRCVDSSDMAFSLRHEFFYYAGFLLRERAKNLLRK